MIMIEKNQITGGNFMSPESEQVNITTLNIQDGRKLRNSVS